MIATSDRPAARVKNRTRRGDWWAALLRLSAVMPPKELGDRLGVSAQAIETWIRKEREPSADNKDALIELEASSEETDRDDTLIYMVQAMREVQRLSSLDGETVALQEIIERLTQARKLADRTLQFLEFKISRK